MSVLLVAPSEGGIAHVARSLNESWAGSALLSVDANGSARGGCDCPPPTTRPTSTARRAVRSAWSHRRCLERASSLHLEVGKLSQAAFWFTIAACLVVRRTPLVVSAHDLPHVVLAPGAQVIRNAPGRRDAIAHRIIAPMLDPVLMWWIRRRASATVVLSERARVDATRLGWPNVAVVDHGAQPPTPTNPAPSEADYALLAGYLGPGKGLDVLAEVWSDADHGMRLEIAGGHSESHATWVAEQRNRLDASDNPPTWHGFVNDDEFADLVRKAAIVLLPYEQSNPASGVVVRALVEGRAVIATSVSAFVDEVEDGRNGTLVPPGDGLALSRAIDDLVRSPETRDRLGSEASRRAVIRHNWDRHVSQLMQVHQSVRADSHLEESAT